MTKSKRGGKRNGAGPIYLCGPINGRSDEDCNGWRTKAKTLLVDFDILDPMRRDYRNIESIAAHQIIENDKDDIDNSEGMLVYFDRPSFGAAMEIFYAFQEGLKVVAVNVSGVPHSPWVEVHTHAITTDLAEGCKMLGDLICS